MTERERWTVYPLLFLSLGIAMRSKITSSLDLREISCHKLSSRQVQIVGDDDRVQLVVSSSPVSHGGGGGISILSATGKEGVVLRASPQGGLIEVFSPEGVLQVGAGVAPKGGLVQTFDPKGKQFRTLAVAVNPLVAVTVTLPPTPAAEEPKTEGSAKPASEPPSGKSGPPSEPPAASNEPAGETPSSGNDEPAKKPADGR